MLFDRYWPDAGTSTTVRDAERLMQIEVTYVGTKFSWLSNAHQGIEVGAVNVHLTANGMEALTDFGHRCLKHAVRRRVRDHDGGNSLAMGRDQLIKMNEIDIATLITRNNDDIHAGHDRAGRICAMGARRDKAHVPFKIPAASVVRPDGEKARKFSLASGIRLQTHGVVTRNFSEHAFEFIN
tara:strand:+ start:176 stop:721 length:546 start_codon:yes stop_codon:yes gene_type:complete